MGNLMLAGTSLWLLSAASLGWGDRSDFAPALSFHARTTERAFDTAAVLGEPTLTAARALGGLNFADLQGIAELDRTRPMAAYWLAHPGRGATAPPLILIQIVPVRPLARSAASPTSSERPPLRRRPTIAAEQIADQLYRWNRNGDVTYVALLDGWALISPSREGLDAVRPRRDALLQPPGDDDLTLTLDWRRFPSAAKDVVTRPLQGGRGAPPAGASAVAGTQFMRAAVLQPVLEQIETVTLSYRRSADPPGMRSQIRVTAVEGGELARSFAASLPPQGSRFADLLRPDADLNLAVAYRLSPAERALLQTWPLDFKAPEVERLKRDQDRFAPLRPAYEELADAAAVAAKTTIAVGRIDLAASFSDWGAATRGTMRMHLLGAERIEGPLVAFLTRAAELAPTYALRPAVRADGDVAVHQFAEQAFCAIAGDTVRIGLGADGDALLVDDRPVRTVVKAHHTEPPLLIEGRLPLLLGVAPVRQFAPPEIAAALLGRRLAGRFRLTAESSERSLMVDLTLDASAVAAFDQTLREVIIAELSPMPPVDALEPENRVIPPTTRGGPRAARSRPVDALRPANASPR